MLNTGLTTRAPIMLALAELEREEEAEFGVVHLADLQRANPEFGRLVEQKRGGHADEVETSLMLAAEPSLVRMDRAAKSLDYPGGRSIVQRSNRMNTTDPYTGHELTGIYGDATLASVEKGRLMWQAIFDAMDPIGEFLSE